MPTEGPDGQSITPSTTTFFNSIVSYAPSGITVEDLGSLLTKQYNRIKEETAQAQSERDSGLRDSLISMGLYTEEMEPLPSRRPIEAPNTRPYRANPTPQTHACDRIAAQMDYIRQVTEDLHLKRDDDNLKPMWALMTKGAAILQSVFRCDITMDAFGSRKKAEEGVTVWSRQIRDMLQGMYNFPGQESKDKSVQRVKFLEGLERLKENMVWYAEFMKRYLDGSEVGPGQDEHLERLNKIGEDIAAFIEELQRLQDKQKKLEEESHKSETVG
jgi:hypothetical protein